MSPATKQAERHVEAVMAALDLLDAFQERPRMTLMELMEATGFTRNRVMRLCGTLEHRGYLHYDPERKLYGLGPRVMVLGKVFERSQDLILLARPILRRLARQTGESASLYVREGLDRVVLAREEGTHDLRFAVTEGQRMELYAGAGGKVLLAHAPQSVLHGLLAPGRISRLTDATLVDHAALAAELARVLDQGYAVSLAERSADSGAIAAPVFGEGGRMVAALGIAGPASRIAGLVDNGQQRVVLDAAAELSRQLGGAPPFPAAPNA